MSFKICVCGRTKNSGALRVISSASALTLLMATMRMDGHDTASQFPHFCDFLKIGNDSYRFKANFETARKKQLRFPHLDAQIIITGWVSSR